MECRLAGETEVLGENLPQRLFCPSQNPTWPDPGLNAGLRGGKPATILLLLLFGLWGYWHCGHSCLLCQPRVIMKMIVEKQMECRLAGETEVLGENLLSATFVHHKIPHNQTRVWTRAAAVGSRRLSAWAMARPWMSQLRKDLACERYNFVVCWRMRSPLLW
jgi:hypothetical protein